MRVVAVLQGRLQRLPMDAAALRAWAKLMHRKSNTLYEYAMFAATAQVHELKVAARKMADFKALGVDVYNPFASRRWIPMA